MKKPILLLTPGDPDGIGPEITWKTIQRIFIQKKKKNFSIVCVGALEPFKKLRAPVEELEHPAEVLTKDESQLKVWLIAAPEKAPAHQFLPGYQAGWSIQQAVQWIQSGVAHALITGPIHKERLQRGGFPFPGHTEFLAQLCQVPHVTMMLANSQLRVSLVTTHLGIRKVPDSLSSEKIRLAIHQTVDGLRNFWGIQKPRLAVAALNPHAGESGLLGQEEIQIIDPEIRKLKESDSHSYEISGSYPADTLFARQRFLPQSERWDAIVCMYHDQALIPIKLLDFFKTVNITLGLPIIRTSVDHGVGFDIAGKGVANESSLCAAIKLASQLVQKKKRRLIP